MIANRYHNVDVLRGFAAFSVTYFHLSGSAGLSNTIASSGSLGYLGVQIFFVISGFIIPVSMMRNEYSIKKFHLFLIKRIVRLDPPYLISVLIAVLFAILSTRKPPSSFELLLHLGKLNSLMHYDWASPVYWTLAVEFQFIILIGLFFKIISCKETVNYLLFSILALVICFLIPNVNLFFHYTPIFMMGVSVFRKINMNKSNWELGISLFLNFVICVYTNGEVEALAAIFTSFFILFYEPSNNILNRCMLNLGKISYSLYLTHWTVGLTIVSVSRHIPGLQTLEIIRLLLGLVFSVFFGYLFYKFVEIPVLNFSRKISPKW